MNKHAAMLFLAGVGGVAFAIVASVSYFLIEDVRADIHEMRDAIEAQVKEAEQ